MILYKVIKESFSEKVTFEQRFKECVGGEQVLRIFGKENSSRDQHVQRS